MTVATKTIPTKHQADQLASSFSKIYPKDRLRFNALPGVTKNWSPDKLVALLQFAADPDAIQQEIADAFGVDRSGISRKVNGINWVSFAEKLEKLCSMTAEEAISYEAEHHAVAEREKGEVKRRKNLVHKETFYKNLAFQLIECAKTHPIKTDPVRLKINQPPSKNTAEHVVLLLSDMHAGLDFTKKETGGLNEFNMTVLRERLKNLQRGIQSIFDIHSRAYQMPELTILCLGDMVQGGNMNGEWGPAHVKDHLVKQARTAAALTSELIEFALQLFPKVSFVGVVGNHGRGGVSKNSDKVGCNWDNVVYLFIETYFHNEPRVKVEYDEDTWWMHKRILNTDFAIVHGDYMKKNARSLKTAHQDMQELVSQQIARNYQVLCIGHFHSFQELETNSGRVLVNGSFVGPDCYSLQNRMGGKPTQTILGVHPRHGITWKYCIDLTVNEDGQHQEQGRRNENSKKS